MITTLGNQLSGVLGQKDLMFWSRRLYAIYSAVWFPTCQTVMSKVSLKVHKFRMCALFLYVSLFYFTGIQGHTEILAHFYFF